MQASGFRFGFESGEMGGRRGVAAPAGGGAAGQVMLVDADGTRLVDPDGVVLAEAA